LIAKWQSLEERLQESLKGKDRESGPDRVAQLELENTSSDKSTEAPSRSPRSGKKVTADSSDGCGRTAGQKPQKLAPWRKMLNNCSISISPDAGERTKIRNHPIKKIKEFLQRRVRAKPGAEIRSSFCFGFPNYSGRILETASDARRNSEKSISPIRNLFGNAQGKGLP